VILTILGMASLVVGCFFFLAGTVGLLRFPEVHSRLHAVTKADTLGLGLVVIGLALQASSVAMIVKLGLIWFLVLVASTTICQVIAHTGLREAVAEETMESHARSHSEPGPPTHHTSKGGR
jgi:multicomponent Na+:H+ antiporter subunit G